MIKKYSPLKLIYLLALLLCLQTGQIVQAQENKLWEKSGFLNFSGVITNPSGKTLADGNYNFTFSLYDRVTGSNPFWSELHQGVPVVNGEINVQLGNGSPANPLNMDFNKKYFLGIKCNDFPEADKRIELMPSPYSYRTLITNQVKDSSITSEKISQLAITDDKIKSISWNKIYNLPQISLKSSRKAVPVTGKTDLPLYWRRYANYLETGNEFLGTVNDRNLVIKTDSIQRLLFDPYGYVQMGTAQDSVFFEVIGKTTFGNLYVKNKAGIGSDFSDTDAKLKIKTTGTQTPFLVDYNHSNVFTISDKGRVDIESTLSGGDADTSNYSLFLKGPDQGMAVKINGSSSNSNYNYMTFWDDNGIAGRIEGLNAIDYLANPKIIAHDVWLAAQGAALVVAFALSALEIPDIVGGGAIILYEAFVTAWDLSHLGVTYESSSGDYAEWLEKSNPNEKFTPGDVVGVIGGKISKNTKDAEQIMSVSLSPAVLGNMPAKGNESNFEKIAFKGQVPVKVLGLVNAGDYIIPSGNGDGFGIAVSPELMTSTEYAITLGRAWESGKSEYLNLVNVAVGLKLKDLALYIKDRLSRKNKIEADLVNKDQELESIISLLTDLGKKYSIMQSRINEMSSGNKKEIQYSVIKNDKY